MRTFSSSVWLGSLTLACALAAPLHVRASVNASGRGAVCNQKNVELNSVAENMGNYDSPPVTPPLTFSLPGYDQCLVALGCTYCRQEGGHWMELSCR